MATLLHIGVPKTGTTAVQAALAELLARTAAAEAGTGVPVPDPGAGGITMPGTPADQARAALSVLGQGLGWRKGEAVASAEHWPRLVTRARESAGTVVVSSEFLCEAGPEVIRRIADDLGPEDLRVVVTLRPLVRILPSAWQQYLKSGHALPYEKWLRAVLADPPKRSVTPSFWRRHDHAAVIERWADGVGADRLTVVVLDDEPGRLLSAFDDLLGLPAGTLVDAPAEHGNRSMTAAEAELFRRVNVVLRRTDVTWSEYAHLIRYGAILRSVERYVPPEGAARVSTPAWALERATELAAGYVTRIDALRPAGLRVIGDLDSLAKPLSVPQAAEAGGTGEPVTTVPIEVAVQALLGTVSRSTTGQLYFPVEEHELAEGLPGSEAAALRRLTVDRLTTRQLAGLLSARVRKRARRQFRGSA